MIELSDIVKNQEVNNTIKYTLDTDLVELAGYQAYLYPPKDDTFIVNNKEYKVVDTIYRDKTGLDALTVKNTYTNEYTIIYVGTDATAENGKQDLITDAQLLSKLTPDQITAARDYFNEMEEKFGEISSITGNSLGGGLTNSVAVEHPDVKAVTLNPAILPDGMIDESQEFNNITNYLSAYDVLTTTEKSLGLGNRIPGVQYRINNGIPEFDKLSTNHTGYLREDDGRQYYQVGDDVIYVDADSHVITSIWTGESLHGGGSSRKIVMDKGNLDMLANALSEDVAVKISRSGGYLENSNEIVEEESNQFYERVHKLQDIFEDLFDQLAGDRLLMGLTSVENLLILEIDFLHTLLNQAESKCLSLNAILNSPPVELLEHVFNQNISVESIFGTARNHLDELKANVSQLSNTLQSIISEGITELFVGGTNSWADAVVGELRAHYGIIMKNKETVLEQVTDFAKEVTSTANKFAQADQAISHAIKNGHSPGTTTSTAQSSKVFTIEESPYLQEGMKFKELHLDIVYAVFIQKIHIKLFPLLTGIKLILSLIESALQALISSVKGLTVSLLHGNLPGKLISLFTDYDDKIKGFVNGALAPLDELRLTIEGIHDGIGRLIVNFSTLAHNFRPYVDSALFSQTNYHHIHLYNLAAMAVLDDMELLFKDIVKQLRYNKSESIDVLSELSEGILTNMTKLYDQVNRCTIN